MLLFLTMMKVLIIMIFLLISVAFFTLLERKMMASMQSRRGPNVVGYLGLLQPLADGLKLFVKETMLPTSSNIYIFLFAPFLAFFLSLMNWAVIPFNEGIVFSNMELGVLYLLAISSLNVYSILLAGWSSNSKYAFLGSISSAAQMISYEIIMSFLILIIVISTQSFNLSKIVIVQEIIWNFIPFFPLFLIFFICSLAETNSHPFDLPEAESELVSGYNVEYSGMGFALFFLAEYANILMMSALNAILFFGGWLGFSFFTKYFFFNFLIFSMKISIFAFLFCWISALLPRFSYDQLMELCWKVFLPLTLSFFMFILCFLFSFNCILL